MNNILETAIREKYRFPTNTIGAISTEQLYDLPLESVTKASLDKVAINIHEEIEKLGKKSFVNKNKKDQTLENKMNIVKHIIELKIDEAKTERKAKENANRKEVLMDVIAEKQTDALKERSIKDLQKEAKSL